MHHILYVCLSVTWPKLDFTKIHTWLKVTRQKITFQGFEIESYMYFKFEIWESRFGEAIYQYLESN